MRGRPGFFEELKRRHVWRVVIAYAVAAWLILQLLSIIFPTFATPAWVLKVVTVLLGAGFPLALVLAWAFDVTPEGVRRTIPAHTEITGAPDDARHIGRRLGTAIISVLAVAVVLLALSYVAHRKVWAAPAILAKSIAVLPFENLSADKNNAYFVTGVQDLILTKLAGIGDLKVIARTSTQQYGSHPQNLKQVGGELGVATLLEGSVQKQGNEVLINVQLINAATASHIWAKSYTRTLDNAFAVEGEVATQIATSLNAKLSPAQAARMAAAPTTNQAATDLFLRAEYQANKSNISYLAGGFSGWRAAIPLYRQAIAKDPGFALAYARLSFVESALAWTSGENVAALTRQARADAEAAHKLAPHAVATLLALGYCDYYGKGDYAGALKTFGAALILRPNDGAALTAQGYVERAQNLYAAALASLQKAFALDPRNSMLAYEIGATYMWVSRYPEAESWLERALSLNPHNTSAKYQYPYTILYGTGDVARALQAAEGNDPVLQSVRVNLLTYQRKFAGALALLDAIPDTLDNFPLAQGSSKALQQADLYRLLGDAARARPLYQKALAALRPQLAKEEQTQNGYPAQVWASVADAELVLGQTKEGLAAIASAQAANAKPSYPLVRAYVTELNASLYAQARRPDLAVPLLAKALTLPAIGSNYAPALLWLDPAWDPIRRDKGFQALLKKYAKDKPVVTYGATPHS